MIYLVTWSKTLENVFQLIGLIIIFILILLAAYFTSKFVGNTNMTNLKNPNIKIIETYKIAPNRFLQIVEISGKYIVIGVSKDHIEYITELEADKVIKDDGEIKPVNFRDVLETIKTKKNNNKKSKG